MVENVPLPATRSNDSKSTKSRVQKLVRKLVMSPHQSAGKETWKHSILVRVRSKVRSSVVSFVLAKRHGNTAFWFVFVAKFVCCSFDNNSKKDTHLHAKKIEKANKKSLSSNPIHLQGVLET